MAMQLKIPSISIVIDDLKFYSSEMPAFLPNDDTWGDLYIDPSQAETSGV